MDINFAKSRADVEAMPGDFVAVHKAQFFELVDRAERGQMAMRVLNSIKTIAGLGAGKTQATS